jgi:hypothetical protein
MENASKAVSTNGTVASKRSKRTLRRSSRTKVDESDDDDNSSESIDGEPPKPESSVKQLKPASMPISTFDRRSLAEVDSFRQRKQGRKAMTALRFINGDSRNLQKVTDQLLEDPRFLVSGFHSDYQGHRAMSDLQALARSEMEQFDCPNESCVKGYRSHQGMLNHVNGGNCIPSVSLACPTVLSYIRLA